MSTGFREPMFDPVEYQKKIGARKYRHEKEFMISNYPPKDYLGYFPWKSILVGKDYDKVYDDGFASYYYHNPERVKRQIQVAEMFMSFIMATSLGWATLNLFMLWLPNIFSPLTVPISAYVLTFLKSIFWWPTILLLYRYHDINSKVRDWKIKMGAVDDFKEKKIFTNEERYQWNKHRVNAWVNCSRIKLAQKESKRNQI